MTLWGDTVNTMPPDDGVEKVKVYPNGIHEGVTFAEYLAQDRVSKSGLWTLYIRSPAHARVEKEESNAMKFGTAFHCALLEPHAFRDRFVRGPVDRRGKKWTEALEQYGDALLTEADYDNALALRDALRDEPVIKQLTGGGTMREVSAFSTDPDTGLPTRARFDCYAPDVAIGCDVKSTEDARAYQFRKRVGGLGYHVQEALYTDTWKREGGILKSFAFIAIEPKPPFAFKIYDLDADAVAEGRAIAQKALALWRKCLDANHWPAYPTKPETLTLDKWDFRETVPMGSVEG